MNDKSIINQTNLSPQPPNKLIRSKNCFERSCSVPRNEINYDYLKSAALQTIKKADDANDYYHRFVGPGSYDIPKAFDNSGKNIYNTNPSYSMGVKYLYHKLYLSKEHIKLNVGKDSPGVGKYNDCISSINPKGFIIGRQERNGDIFTLQTDSPGPKYNTKTIEEIGCPDHVKKAHYIKGNQRFPEYFDNVTSKVVYPNPPSCFENKKNNSNLQKGRSFGPSSGILQDLWKKTLILCKKAPENIPGPGAYNKIYPIKSDLHNLSFSKASKEKAFYIDNPVGPGKYNVSTKNISSRQKNCEGNKFPLSKRLSDARKY